jgi:hypothetical protein
MSSPAARLRAFERGAVIHCVAFLSGCGVR